MGDEDEARPQFVAQLADQLEDLRLDGDVERRRRLVGDHERGRPGYRHGDHDPLTETTGKLMWVGTGPRDRIGDAHRAQEFHRGAEVPRCLRHLPADAHRRVQRRHGVLEDRAHVQFAHLAPGVRARSHHVDPAHDRLARHLGSRPVGQQTEQRQRHDALPRPRLAHQADDLARADVEGHPTDSAHLAPPAGERHAQVLDLDQRTVVGARPVRELFIVL